MVHKGRNTLIHVNMTKSEEIIMQLIFLDMCQHDHVKNKISNLWEYLLTCVNMIVLLLRVPLDMCQHNHAKNKLLNFEKNLLTCVNVTMPRVSSQIWWKYYLTCVNMTMPRVECQICGGWRLLGMCQYDQAKSKNHVTWRKIRDLCQYDQIKNHHTEEKSKDHATWRKSFRSVSIWPNQEPSYQAKKLLDSRQYVQAKGKNWATWKIIHDLCQCDQIKNHHMRRSYLAHVNMTKPTAKIEQA